MSEFLLFPRNTNIHYYKIHYQYIRDIFEFNGNQIVDTDNLELSNTSFKCVLANQEIAFDFSDNGNEILENSPIPVFKFHFREEHYKLKNVYPFTPVSFYFKDWFKLQALRKEITYKAIGERVMNNQRPYGNAVMRRNIVRNILQTNYRENVDVQITPQEEYWRKINDCLTHVFVPGQNNHMLDRGQLQFMGLGCCTISPSLPEILPFNKKLAPFVHYLQVKDDYTDIVGSINFIKNYRRDCVKIGKNAMKLFDKTCTPKKLVEWIKICIKESK